MTGSAPSFPGRLLVLAGYWPTRSNRISGIFVVQQAEALQRSGWEVTVAVPTPLQRLPDGPDESLEQRLRQLGIAVHRIPVLLVPERLARLPGIIGLNSRIVGAAVAAFLWGHSRRRKFDACLAHGLRYCGFGIAWADRILRGSAVVMIHGVDPLLEGMQSPRAYRDVVRRMSERLAAIVLVGTPLKGHADKVGLATRHMHVVGNGHDAPAGHTVSDTQTPIGATRHVLSVCNLVPSKGVDDCLRALSLLSAEQPLLKWEYRVVGDGPMMRDLQQLALDLGLGEQVKFLGRLDYEATMAEMAKADVFCLPSWKEAFGIVYLEAMARMRPVIGCTGTGAEDFVRDGEHGYLVPQRNPALLAAALRRLLEDPELCMRLGREGHALAVKRTWDENARIIGGLLSPAGGSAA